MLDDDGSEFDGNKVSRFLNIAAQDIQSIPAIKRYLFPTYSSSVTMTSGTAYVTLPTGHNYDVQKVVYNPGTSERALQWIEFPELAEKTENNQTVYYYTVRGNRIYLAGTPTSTDNGVSLGIWYSTGDSTIANDGSETTLGTKAHQCLIYRAAQLLALTAPDLIGVSDRFGKLYDDSLQKLSEEADEKATSESKYTLNEQSPDAL